MSTKKSDKRTSTFPLRPDQDPIVEILRLAYRRGLAIQRENAKKAATILPEDTDRDQETTNTSSACDSS